jgi:hypothetical protein
VKRKADPLAKLRKHLEFVAGPRPSGSLWFVITDDFHQQQAIVEDLKENVADFSFKDFSYKVHPSDQLWDRVRETSVDEPTVFTVRDFDQLDPDALNHAIDQLNRGREVINRGPFHMIMFILEPTLPEFIHRAGDFWSWSRGTTYYAQKQTPSFDVGSLDNVLRRYSIWLKNNAFAWERMRLWFLQKAIDKADFEWHTRKGVDERERVHDLDDIVGRQDRQLLVAPLGYYKAKEMIAYLDRYLDQSMANTYAQEIPVAIDCQQLDLKEPLWSEQNKKKVFGAFASLLELRKQGFRIFCVGFEHLEDDHQVQVLHDLEQLKPKQIIVTCNDQFVRHEVFEPSGFQRINMLPIPYRWLERNIRQRWGLNLRYRKNLYELIRIPEVSAALVDKEEHNPYRKTVNCIAWSLASRIKSIAHFFNQEQDSEFLKLLERHDSFEPLSRKNEDYSSAFRSVRGTVGFFSMLHSGYYLKADPQIIEIAFQIIENTGVDLFLDEYREIRGSFYFVSHRFMLICLSFVTPYEKNSFISNIHAIDFKDQIIVMTLLFFYLSPEIKRHLMQKRLDSPVSNGEDPRLVHLISIVRLTDNWSDFKRDMLETFFSRFKDWFLDSERAQIPEDMKSFWIETLHEAYEEPIFDDYLRSTIEAARNHETDPVTREIAHAVLSPPPLPEQAVYEDRLYGSDESPE